MMVTTGKKFPIVFHLINLEYHEPLVEQVDVLLGVQQEIIYRPP